MMPRSLCVVALAAAVGCGGKSHELSTAGGPADPNAPQVAFSADEPKTESASAVALPPEADAPFIALLDAYLAIGDRLAADRTDGVSEQAQTFVAALEQLTLIPPEKDPHFWHPHDDPSAEERERAVAEARNRAGVLAETPEIKTARLAYGHLSAAVNALLGEIGVPAGYGKPLKGYVCGMFQGVPQNGVWIQTDGATRNPYFGRAMLECATDAFAVRAAPARANHDGHESTDQPHKH